MRPAAAVVDALASPEAAAIFAAFTRGPVRFRLDWERGGHRRAEVWRVAGAIAARRPDLVNDPTDSTWRVHVAEDGDRVADRARAAQARRSALRLPRGRCAGRLAPDRGRRAGPAVGDAQPGPADDVVWDPFVGSGLELCERGRLAPFGRLVGSDISTEALAAARANVESAGVTAELVVGDALGHDVPGATVILTNPPMGRRVLRGRAEPLLVEIVDRAAAILPAGGLLCWISPIPGQTRARAGGRRATARRRPSDRHGRLRRRDPGPAFGAENDQDADVDVDVDVDVDLNVNLNVNSTVVVDINRTPCR